MPEMKKGAYKLADFKHEPPYERRVVVFYDFLGWQSHIDHAGEDPKKLGLLRRMLLRHPRMLGVKEDLEIRYSTFSDNVVITQKVGPKTQMLIQQLANFQLGAALPGFLLRGGITIGDIVHDDEVVFGPGLNRAYYLESKVAKFPRLVLDSLVRKEFGDLGGLPVEEDDVCFLDPFRLEYCEHLRRAKMEDTEAVANAGLPIPQGKFKDFSNDDILCMIIESLNEQFQKPTTDEVFAKLAWIYDRIAKQVGHPLSSALPRIRPKP
jgi:hypothetical protein